MDSLDLILTLSGGLAVALVCGYVTFRLGLSPIVGYLVAGILVGPHTPGFIANAHLAEQLAEVGVVLLMFGVGLQFHIDELLSVRRVALPGAVIRCSLATLLGGAVGVAFGWSLVSSLVFGLALSVASTVVLVRVLSENRDLHTPAGHIAVGWLVVEDLFTVLILVLLPAVAGPEAGGGLALAREFGLAIAKLAAMVALMGVVGERVIPWLLDRVAATRSRELFTLAVLVLALGIAVGSAKLFGVSMALGAFLAGLVVGRSDFSLRAATEALPMRDAFAVLFFVSVGILFDPREMMRAPLLTAATLALVLVAKPLITIGVVLLKREPMRVALPVAATTANIGEFSFILAAEALDLGLVDEQVNSTLVTAAIVSITLNPLLYRLKGPVLAWLGRGSGRKRVHGEVVGTETAEERGLAEDRAIVVGYGPVGRGLVRVLRENGVEPVVVELNMETVRRLNAQGIRAIYGDASHVDTLLQAGAEEAVAFLLSSASMQGCSESIRQARELNPEIRVYAHVSFLRDLEALRLAGADAVFSGEGEVVLSMAEFLLRQLGATAEQIDRERERLRGEMVVGPAAASVEDRLPLRGPGHWLNPADRGADAPRD